MDLFIIMFISEIYYLFGEQVNSTELRYELIGSSPRDTNLYSATTEPCEARVCLR